MINNMVVGTSIDGSDQHTSTNGNNVLFTLISLKIKYELIFTISLDG